MLINGDLISGTATIPPMPKLLSRSAGAAYVNVAIDKAAVSPNKRNKPMLDSPFILR
jgi:hypothetical protein